MLPTAGLRAALSCTSHGLEERPARRKNAGASGHKGGPSSHACERKLPGRKSNLLPFAVVIGVKLANLRAVAIMLRKGSIDASEAFAQLRVRHSTAPGCFLKSTVVRNFRVMRRPPAAS